MLRQLLERSAYDLYLARLRLQMREWKKPHHVGIVMDGNRRFAKAAGARHVIEGHNRGADKLDDVLQWCERAGVAGVSVWAFSLDNFKRERAEIDGLMALFERKFIDLVTDERVHRDHIRVRGFGRLELLPEAVQRAIKDAEQATAHYTRRFLNVGLAYGGREEIVDGFHRYLQAHPNASTAELRAGLTPENFEKYLYTAHAPDPDLIIRTSGEVRLSGFMLWQSAYSEFYFCDTHWPAFREIDFLRALRAYHHRQRRFGV